MSRSNTHRRSARRLPWWIRRAVRLWARCVAWAAGGHAGGAGLRDAAAAELELLVAVPADERRCGWFDSSLDLREGLAVSEHEASDPVVAELPVRAWVQLQLSGWQPAVPAAAA